MDMFSSANVSPALLVGSLVVVAVGAYFTYLFVISPNFHPLNALPGPPPTSIFFGNGKEVAQFAWDEATPFPGVQGQWLEQYGPAYHTRVFATERLVIADPDALKHVLVSNVKNYPRHVISRSLLRSFTGGIGLLSSEDPTHAGQRKMLNPHFAYAKLKTFVDIFSQHAQTVNALMTPKADTSDVVDMFDLMTKLSFDIIGLAAFGLDFNALHNDSADIMAAFDDLNTVPSLFFAFGNAYVPGFDHLPLADLRKRKAAKKVLFQAVHDVIATKLSAPPTTSRDLLDLMLDSPEHKMTADEARVHVMTFLFAGHETTSNTLCWVFAMLATHPDVEARVVDECQRVMATGHLSWEAFGELKYLTAVIYETLRINPTVMSLATRVCETDDNIPMVDGKPVFCPAGTQIVMSTAAIHRNATYWTRPNEFLPERFLEGSALHEADKALRHGRSSTFFFTPFSTGPKNCIGNRFALAELQAVLATVVSKYQFSLHASADIHPKLTGVTLKPKNLAMTVRRRI